MRIDSQLNAPLGLVGDQARELERLGFDGAFTFEGPNDVFFPLVEAALASDLDLYTNVAIAFPRSPLHLAHAAWDLQRMSDGRFALGLGSQVRAHVERRYGAEFDQPAKRMREFVTAIKAIFASWQHGDRLDVRGEFTTHTLMPPLFNPGPLADGPPPIWVGAVGPGMTRAVAQSADGLLVHPFHSERFMQGVLVPRVESALSAAGRAADSFSYGVDVILCIGRNDEEQAAADTGARMLLGFYGSTPAYREVLELHGWTDLQPRLQSMTRAGDWATMAELITDEMLATLTVRGRPAQAAAELHRRYGQVADRIGLSMPYHHEPTLAAEVTDDLRALS